MVGSVEMDRLYWIAAIDFGIIFAPGPKLFAVVILSTIVFIFYYSFPQSRSPSLPDASTYVKEQRAIADFSALNAKSLSDRLSFRALPNTRLIRAFDLLNSFTTLDENVHNRFLKSARDIVHTMDAGRWARLSQVANQALDLALYDLDPPMAPLHLAPLARTFCFITIIHLLFQADLKQVNVGQARIATEAINHLWVQSKDPLREVSRRDQDRLQAALRALLPERFPWSPEDNPLNLIMPSYETMWRVVLLTFISAAFQSAQDTMAQFQGVVESVPQCLGQNDIREKVALAFATEGLRLYPPTKSVYRGVLGAEGSRNTCNLLAANIEKCHRDRTIWGDDALQFRPSRFCSEQDINPRLSKDMRQAYMPFGVGKHECPAKAGFGNRAIIILVVSLAKRLGSKNSGSEFILGSDKFQGNLKTPLPSGRKDMENWRLNVGYKKPH
ncbi:hypothetical protein F5B20DRAFT_534384 [Whalleya microplaca]|nr:hypothetical protein F5B20DRAFT_534384 [Whalleya microplaca]